MSDALRAAADAAAAAYLREYDRADLWHRVAAAVLAAADQDGLRARNAHLDRLTVSLYQEREAAVREAAALRAELAAFHEHHALDEQVRDREAALRAGVEALVAAWAADPTRPVPADDLAVVMVWDAAADALRALLAEHPTPEPLTACPRCTATDGHPVTTTNEGDAWRCPSCGTVNADYPGPRR